MRAAIIPLSALGSQEVGEIRTVCVTAEEGLNIRTGPGAHFSKVGALGKKEIVRVVKEHQGSNFRWGKLGERRWIALDFTVEVS